MKKKFSRQRQCITEYLLQTKEHPTAEMVYRHVQEKYPNISLGTVYRNLNLLVEQGQIMSLSCGDGCERFDGHVEPHNHFICRNCGCILDLDMDSFEHINTLAGVRFAGRIDGNVTYFYGLCENCLMLKKGETENLEMQEKNKRKKVLTKGVS